MRNTIFAIIIICLLMASSCSKTTSNNNNNCSTSTDQWVFKSINYTEATCRYSSGGILGATSVCGPGSSLTFSFKNALPTTGGSFAVVTGAPSTASQILVSVSFGGVVAAVYDPLGTGSVAVTVGSNGMLNLTGTNIPMVNNYTPFDTATISFNVLQLQ